MNPADNQVPTASIPAARVRLELDRIANSEAFQRSPQLQRFLRFIVEETLSGRGERLKEYVIGTEVFGRPANYDPQLDSLVRVEAHRLRAVLEQYYSQPGADGNVRIELNKGSYVPAFREKAAAQETPLEERAPRRTRYRLWVMAASALTMVLLAGAWFYQRQRAHHELLPSDATIAVLPFDNLSPEPGSEYFCFGLVDEITTELAKSGKLRVVARTSASRFKRGDDVRSIGRQLKADAVLEGSVQRSADRVRVTAQLISAADNLHVWSESYERPSSNLFAVQDEVAQAVTSAVQSHIAGSTGKQPRQIKYSADPLANQLYWKAVYFRAPMGRTGWRRDLATSAEFLERAVEKDPQFAQAYAVMADDYVSMGWERGGGTGHAGLHDARKKGCVARPRVTEQFRRSLWRLGHRTVLLRLRQGGCGKEFSARAATGSQ